MKKHNKWLLRKVSGSRGKYTYKPDYSDFRNQKNKSGDSLPYRESMHKNRWTWLDTSLVKRWLYQQVGQNFDLVYANFLKRIQPKYLAQYRDCIFFYVKKAHEVQLEEKGELTFSRRYKFFINPVNNCLERYPEQKRKSNLFRKLESTLGNFYYSYKKEKWELNTSEPDFYITDKHLEVDSNFIQKIEKLYTQKAKIETHAEEAIHQFAHLIQRPEIIQSRKDLLAIHFTNPKNHLAFSAFFETSVYNEKLWKIDFYQMEVLEVKRVCN